MDIQTPKESLPAEAGGSRGGMVPGGACTDTLFQEPWWLNAVAPGMWEAATVERSGQVVARLPYLVRRHRGLLLCDLPMLTQTLGPWIEPLEASEARRRAREKELMTELIDRLPRFDLFMQSFNHRVDNWLPFHWRGFRQTTRYTYVIEDLSDLDRVWSRFSTTTRNRVSAAERGLTVRDDLGVGTLHELATRTFRRQGLPLPYGRDFLERVVDAAMARGQGVLRFAVDARERVHGAVFNVHDARSTFGLVSGYDPELRSSNCGSLLVWESIRAAAARSRAFDFEGSMIEPIEQTFRGYGGTMKPYMRVTGMSRRMRMMKAVEEIARAAVGR